MGRKPGRLGALCDCQPGGRSPMPRAGLLTLILCGGMTMAAAAQTTVVLGTATPGGGFPLNGGAVADTINQTDPSLKVEPRNTKGSTENVPLLEAGQLDIALIQGEVAY